MVGFFICIVICILVIGIWWRERDINVIEERFDGVKYWFI